MFLKIHDDYYDMSKKVIQFIGALRLAVINELGPGFLGSGYQRL